MEPDEQYGVPGKVHFMGTCFLTSPYRVITGMKLLDYKAECEKVCLWYKNLVSLSRDPKSQGKQINIVEDHPCYGKSTEDGCLEGLERLHSLKGYSF